MCRSYSPPLTLLLGYFIKAEAPSHLVDRFHNQKKIAPVIMKSVGKSKNKIALPHRRQVHMHIPQQIQDLALPAGTPSAPSWLVQLQLIMPWNVRSKLDFPPRPSFIRSFPPQHLEKKKFKLLEIMIAQKFILGVGRRGKTKQLLKKNNNLACIILHIISRYRFACIIRQYRSPDCSHLIIFLSFLFNCQ